MQTEYITKDGDRIDTIASNAYGDPFRWEEILYANPTLPILPVYAGGIRIIIPIIEEVDLTESDKVPAWKK